MENLSVRELVAHIEQGLDGERRAKLKAGEPPESAAIRGLVTMREVVGETPTERESAEEWLEMFFDYANSRIKQHARDVAYGGGPEAMQNALGCVEATAHALGLQVETHHRSPGY